MKKSVNTNLAFYMFYTHWLTRLDDEIHKQHGFYLAALPRFKPNLRKPYLFKAFTKANYALRYLLHANAGDRKGVTQLMQIPMALVEADEFYVLSLALNSECTPASLKEFALPLPADCTLGVIIESCEAPWLISYIAIEYSKIMNWVAIGTNGVATIVYGAGREGEVLEY